MRSGPRPRDGELAFLIARSVVVVIAPRRAGRIVADDGGGADVVDDTPPSSVWIRYRASSLRRRSTPRWENLFPRRSRSITRRRTRWRDSSGRWTTAPRRNRRSAKLRKKRNDWRRRCRRRRRRAESRAPRAGVASADLRVSTASTASRPSLAVDGTPTPSTDSAILRSVRRRDVARFRRERVRLESERTSRDGPQQRATLRRAAREILLAAAARFQSPASSSLDAKHRRVRRRVDARLRVPLRRRRSVRTSILFHGMRLRLRHRRSRLLRVSSLRHVSPSTRRVGRMVCAHLSRVDVVSDRWCVAGVALFDTSTSAMFARGDVDPRREM